MSDLTIWAIIGSLGVLTFLTRFSFLGLIGSRPLPLWVLRHLRYTGVAVLPGLVAPLVVWPAGAGGGLDHAYLIAGVVTVGVGVWRRDVIVAALAGGVLFGAFALLG